MQTVSSFLNEVLFHENHEEIFEALGFKTFELMESIFSISQQHPTVDGTNELRGREKKKTFLLLQL